MQQRYFETTFDSAVKSAEKKEITMSTPSILKKDMLFCGPYEVRRLDYKIKKIFYYRSYLKKMEDIYSLPLYMYGSKMMVFSVRTTSGSLKLSWRPAAQGKGVCVRLSTIIHAETTNNHTCILQGSNLTCNHFSMKLSGELFFSY